MLPTAMLHELLAACILTCQRCRLSWLQIATSTAFPGQGPTCMDGAQAMQRSPSHAKGHHALKKHLQKTCPMPVRGLQSDSRGAGS